MRTFGTRLPWSTDVSYRFRVASLAFFLSAIAVETRGQSRDEPVRVAHLIDRLGSTSFARRQAAQKALLEIGQPSIVPLEKAAAADDPEVRLRAEKMLGQLKTQRLWSASMIERASADRLASVILKEAAESSGNRLAFGGRFDNFVDRQIQVQPGPIANRQPVAYWQVVDEVCRQTGNHLSYRRQAETGASVIVAGKPGNYPLAYAGPLRVHLKQAQRTFSEKLDYDEGSSDLAHTFAIDLAANWETRCRLLAYRSDAQVVAAITDQGQRLLTAPGATGGWSIVQSGVGQIETTVRLQPPSVAASHLKKLHLRWEFIAAGDPQTIEITDLETPRVYRQDDVQLVFEGIEKQSDTRYEVSFVVARAALITELKDLAQIENEVVLLDERGTKMSAHAQAVASTANSRRKTPFISEGMRTTIAFVASSPEHKPTKLRFTYPKIRSRKPLDIIFHDVRLPSTPVD